MQEKKPLGLILCFLFLSLAGQYLFKMGMSCEAGRAIVAQLAGDFGSMLASPLSSLAMSFYHSVVMMLQPYVFLGLLCYALSTVCWLALLSKVDLSFAYPMISLGYVGILLMGWLAFGEQVSLMRWLGVILISVGIVAVYSEKRFLSWGLIIASALAIMSAILLMLPGVNFVEEQFEKPLLLILITIPLGIIGQILFKAGMNQPLNKDRVKEVGGNLGQVKEGRFSALWPSFVVSLKLFLSWQVFSGLLVYVLSTVIWLVLLSKVPLTFLYPLLSVGYVVILLLGKFLFHEQVTAIRWYGVFLICLGIVTIYSESLVFSHLGLFASLMLVMAAFLAFCAWRPQLVEPQT